MTATLDILSDDFPHGTVTGHRSGCKTNHCPAPIPCHEFARRVVSDWQFSKRVAAGWSVVELHAADVSEAEERRQAERSANRRIREAVKRESKAAKKMARYRYGEQVRPTPKPFTDAEIADLRRMNAEGKTDTEITAAMGRPFGSVTAKRSALGLPRNKPAQVIPHGTYAGYAAGCRDKCCHEPAKAYWRANAANKRRREGVPMKEEAA